MVSCRLQQSLYRNSFFLSLNLCRRVPGKPLGWILCRRKKVSSKDLSNEQISRTLHTAHVQLGKLGAGRPVVIIQDGRHNGQDGRALCGGNQAYHQSTWHCRAQPAQKKARAIMEIPGVCAWALLAIPPPSYLHTNRPDTDISHTLPGDKRFACD